MDTSGSMGLALRDSSNDTYGSSDSDSTTATAFGRQIDRYLHSNDHALTAEAKVIGAYINDNRVFLRIGGDLSAAAHIRRDVETLVARVAELSDDPTIQRLHDHFREFNAAFSARDERSFADLVLGENSPFTDNGWFGDKRRIWREFAEFHPPEILEHTIRASTPALQHYEGEGADAVLRYPDVTLADNIEGLRTYTRCEADANLRQVMFISILAEWSNRNGITVGQLTAHGIDRETILRMAPELKVLDMRGSPWLRDPDFNPVAFFREVNDLRTQTHKPPIPIRVPDQTRFSLSAWRKFAPQLLFMAMPGLGMIPAVPGQSKMDTVLSLLRSAVLCETLEWSADYTLEVEDILRELPIRTLHIRGATIHTPINLAGHPTLEELTIEYGTWMPDDADARCAPIILTECPCLRRVKVDQCHNFVGGVATAPDSDGPEVTVHLRHPITMRVRQAHDRATAPTRHPNSGQA